MRFLTRPHFQKLRERQSLRYGFIKAQLITSGILLAITSSFFITSKLVFVKESLEGHVDYTANILIQSLIPAINFRDSEAAKDSLAHLKIDDHFLMATVRLQDNRVFATYKNNQALAVYSDFIVWGIEGLSFAKEFPIRDRGEVLGSLYILTSTKQIVGEMSRFVFFILGIVVVLLIVSFFLSYLFEKKFSHQLHLIIKKMQAFSKQPDIKVRELDLESPTREIFQLDKQFQELAVEVQKRDLALQKTNELLEKKVQERTEELQMAQKQLIEEARRAGVADVATGVLHNISNILNTVSTNSELVHTRVNKSNLVKRLSMANSLLEEQKDDLPSFFRNSEKAPLLIEYLKALETALLQDFVDMKAYSKTVLDATAMISEIIDHQQTLALGSQYKEVISLEELVERVLHIKQNYILRSGVNIEVCIRDLPSVLCYKARLFQVLVNLLINACQAVYDYRTEGGQVKFSGLLEENSVVLSIADNGPGIDPSLHSKLFTYGFTTKSNGHGFGLHSCKVYLDEMKATIRYQTSDDLGGAEFLVALPIS